jgi:predicted TIM-barrel fold metal-dependent hydrolase
MIDPETMTPAGLRDLRNMGYRGLKMIGVRRAYDCEDYFPVYETAEKFGWPVLLHMGVIGGGIDYARTHPRRDPDAAEMYYRWETTAAPRNMSAMRMRPFHMDTIANNFPRLKIIGAHLGGTGNYDEAASVARWRHHAYFDISGGTTIERHAVERGLIGKEIGIEKLIFGSDTAPERIADHVSRWEAIFALLDLTAAEKERIWWLNGAELYGLARPHWRKGAKAGAIRVSANGARAARPPAARRKRRTTKART